MRSGLHGIVLAGGASRRMGRDKALVELDGRPLAAWTVARLKPQCRAIAISRHDGRLEGLDLGLPLLADATATHQGPLAGLLAALDWVAAIDPAATHAVTVAVDTPFLPPDFVARLVSAREAADAPAAVAASGERRHPVAALWPVAARTALRDAMEREGLRRVGVFLDRLAPATARWPVDPLDPFLNLNTPGDLAAAPPIRGRLVATQGESDRASRRCDDA